MANSDSLYLSVMKKKVSEAYSRYITRATMASRQSMSSMKFVTEILFESIFWAPNYYEELSNLKIARGFSDFKTLGI